ncbi:hypothetical protein P8452_76223 [Trifolium repens]|nr:hypothetical protein P8452_76223 [Trifolium repens]
MDATTGQSLYPLHHSKTIHLVRHAQGVHNVEGEKNHDAYLSDDLFDANLTPLGWKQFVRALVILCWVKQGKPKSTISRLHFLVLISLATSVTTKLKTRSMEVGNKIMAEENDGCQVSTLNENKNPTKRISPN